MIDPLTHNYMKKLVNSTSRANCRRRECPMFIFSTTTGAGSTAAGVATANRSSKSGRGPTWIRGGIELGHIERETTNRSYQLLRMLPCPHGSSRSAAAGSARNAVTSASRDRSRISISRVGPLPTRNQITLGGGPSVAAKCWKSLSFETTAKSFAAAKAQTARSSAPLRPAETTCLEPGYSFASSAGKRQDRF